MVASASKVITWHPWHRISILVVGGLMLGLSSGCGGGSGPDEARAAGKTARDYPTAQYDYFHDMDQAVPLNKDGESAGPPGPLQLTIDEIKGRNTWMMWCGGNERFWDYLAGHSYGFMDLLKLVASQTRAAGLKKRSERFTEAGLINEPECDVAVEADEYGLFLEPPTDPHARKPDPAVYGSSSGVIGLRLFKNPAFDARAKQQWKPDQYFGDPSYFTNPSLIRPYRVGMSCAFCHAAPHPLLPPKDGRFPKWENLSSNIGNQYFRTQAVFGGLLKPDSFVYHILDSQPPGTIDTSSWRRTTSTTQTR